MYEKQEREKKEEKEKWAKMEQIKQHILNSSEPDYRQFVTAFRQRARRCGGGGWQQKKANRENI